MKNYLSHLLEGGWNIAVRQQPTGTILDDLETEFKIIPNTWRTWAADPFIFENKNQVYIFAELFDYIKRKGSIGYTTLRDGRWTPWKVVIDEPFHMSYPNIFRSGKHIYMIPESSGGDSLRLYKAVRFPNKWKLLKTIAEDVKWVDTTFFDYEGKKCAITTDVSEEDNHVDYLLMFDKKYNIISKTKIEENHTEFSRSGGNFFERAGQKIRVSQDCSEHYGGGMIFSNFSEIDLVTCGMNDEILHLYPADVNVSDKRKWTGLHTYNSTDHYEVVDIERKHFNLFGILSRLFSKIR